MLKFNFIFSIIFIGFINNGLVAQKLSLYDRQFMVLGEKALDSLEKRMFLDSSDIERKKADSIFIPQLVKTLKTPYSYYYNFDSFKFIKQLFSPDSIFKIFTWNFYITKSQHRHQGVIQINTIDGSLKIFPLIDASEFEDEPEKIIAMPLPNKNINTMWIGASYYKIIKKNYQNNNYYTLLGFDDASDTTSIKWIDILYFNEDGKPIFGGDFFDLTGFQDANIHPLCKRFRYVFKKYAKASLNYDDKNDRIYFSNLISLTGNRLDGSSLVPEGNIDYFIWEGGKWCYKIGD